MKSMGYFWSTLFYHPAVWPSTSNFLFLNLNFLIYKMGTIGVLWNYYCAQLKCEAPQRSPINPNLMCIWSQFGRGNRPRTEETACVHAWKKKKRKEEKALPPCQGPSWLLHPLGAHRIIPGTTARFYPPVFCLLSTDQSDLFSTPLRKWLWGFRTSPSNVPLFHKDY